MNVRPGYLSAVLAVSLAAGCAYNNASNPSEPSSTPPPDAAGVSASVTAPQPVSPADGAQIRNADQPVTLTVRNVVTTSSATPTYTFEVGTDANFGTKAFTKAGVAEGSGGQTTVTIDRLSAGADYFWHVRAEGSGTVGRFGPARRMTIGPAIVINPPTPIAPPNGSSPAGWPTFVIANSARSGPVGALSYRFEVSTSSVFASTIISAVVAETPNQTSYTPPSSTPLPANQATLYWRATAIDSANSLSSQPSAPLTFVSVPPSQAGRIAAQQGVSLWPGVQPTGSNGSATMSLGWQVGTQRSFDGTTFQSPPIDALRIFDLIDRGMDPGGAINWMNANGYGTTAVWYPSVLAVGLPHQYMALVNGQWELVTRVGA